MDVKTIRAITGSNFLIPKELIFGKDKRFSLYAAFTYSLLTDRAMNPDFRERDEDGNAYILFPRNDLADILNVNKNKVTKVMRELADAGLIFERRMGLRHSNRIYVAPIRKAGG